MSYPDQHQFKFEVASPCIYNAAGGGGVRGTGCIVLGTPTTQRTNFSQFGGVINFNLAFLMAYDYFLKTNFDRYRINLIKVRVIPENNFSQVSGTGTLATMKIVRDYDDANLPTVGDIEIRRGTTYLLNKPFSFSLKPKMLTGIYSPAVTGSAVIPAGVKKADWINMGYAQVPHLGIKFMVRDWFNAGNDLQVRFQITYMVSVREQLQVGRAPSLQNDAAPDGIEELFPDANEPEVVVPCPPETT